MPETIIRRANQADLAEVQRLNKGLYDYEGALGYYEDSFDQDWTYGESGTEYFTDRLSDSADSVAFVAEADGRIIGYLAAGCRSLPYRMAAPVAEIENMFVEEDNRRQGVGRQLTEAFKRWAAERGAGRMRVTAFSQNHQAIWFYRKCGFHDFELTLEM